MIELNDLRKTFGHLVAVDGISMSVAKGEILGFLGPNGAGKSTTMKMVAGFLAPTSGSARVCGVDVEDDPVTVKRSLGYLPEGAPAYGDMTAASFLDFAARVRGYDTKERKARIDAVIDQVDLAGVLDQPIDTLSKGYKRRVGVAQAILHDPPVLILDEPTDGLDPNQKHQVRSLIRAMASDKAVVISTHILEEVEAVCTRAVIIANGRLMADGTPDELVAKSPLHHAVCLEVETAKIGNLESDLAGMAEVGAVETMGRTGGRTRLRVLSASGAPIAVDVGALVHDRGYEVAEMYTEKGALDEVFRQITTKNGETEHA